ncbi:MAG: flavodoxin [Bacillota bacterium]|nr:flavodoxin [Bacillota bacterium]MDW7676841.1 flavodoxin [Bacillota bacterium]
MSSEVTDHPQNIKSLVIYYSHEGSTRLIAESMADAIGADLLPLIPKKEMTRHGFSKYFWGGSQVMMKRKPELLPFEVDPLEYDLILIGTPVWAWTFSPPVAALLKTVDFSGKKIGLFSCHGGQNGRTFLNLKKHLADSQVLGEIDFFEPVKKDTKLSVERAKTWAREIADKSQG